jgi:hypothetical protein
VNWLSKRMAGLAVSSMIAGLLAHPGAATAAPPRPAPPASVTTLCSGTATDLETLEVVSNPGSPLAPEFSADIHHYQMINTSGTSTLRVVPDDSDADVSVSLNRVGQSVTAEGEVTLNLTRGRNEVKITVSTSCVNREVYHVAIWYGAAPLPEIAGAVAGTSTVYGGGVLTLLLRDGYLPSGCQATATVNGQNAYPLGVSIDGVTGLTQMLVLLPPAAGYEPGTYDLTLTFYCQGDQGWYTSLLTVPNAITYTDNYQITGIDVPTPMTAGSRLVAHGTGVGIVSKVGLYLIKPGGDGAIPLSAAGLNFSGADDVPVIVPYGEGSTPEFLGSGPRTIVAALCPTYRYEPATCQTKWSRSVTWEEPAPAGLSFSPAYGAVAGGTTIRLRGRFLVSGNGGLTIKIGDQTVPRCAR